MMKRTFLWHFRTFAARRRDVSCRIPQRRFLYAPADQAEWPCRSARLALPFGLNGNAVLAAFRDCLGCMW